jgi:hypothetical protein
MCGNMCIIDLMQFCLTGYEQFCHERECKHCPCGELVAFGAHYMSLLVTSGLYSEV